jgi:hypothetical protein
MRACVHVRVGCVRVRVGCVVCAEIGGKWERDQICGVGGWGYPWCDSSHMKCGLSSAIYIP